MINSHFSEDIFISLFNEIAAIPLVVWRWGVGFVEKNNLNTLLTTTSPVGYGKWANPLSPMDLT